ncbi:MAG: hypothetical protein HN737_13925 [Desulfobacterales bacterium]|jgi:hypothetical protein|nr:hypothetical protein [Desulfobacteraceae bacterium]MBT4365763.1 hypothetical protein [Desulfobacteraceae bacterium]MBT7085017.1 hypothetical protein [Desulfobacterales bacterium]MBT7698493.1 hypothetical protein [Desulfobacterales bacterium]
MQLKYLLFIFFLLVFIAGCEKERVYQSIYEGMNARERIINPSNDPNHNEQQSYDQYKREREESFKKDN